MSRDRAEAPMSAGCPPKQRSWLEQTGRYFYPYRPRLRERHFWIILGLVVAIVALHAASDLRKLLGDLGLLYLPASLFLAPVVYAALTFGMEGAVATAVWATIISIPSFILAHEGTERLGEVFQLGIVNIVAVLVGRQVDRKRNALHLQEAAATALNASITRYRSLLESSPVAILVIDPEGLILEANQAAGTLFTSDKVALEKQPVARWLGMASAEKLLAAYRRFERPDILVMKHKDGTDLYLEPTIAETNDGKGNVVIQVLLRDVTEEQQRHAGLRAYAAYVMRAQEEERQRIARELHDETIQALVVLCRRLSTMESECESLSPSLANKLEEARQAAEEIVGGLRSFSKALRPPILDDLGMVVSIRRLLADFAERTGAGSHLRVAGQDRRLPPDTELALFRITQEALWNVEHHAGGTSIVVTVTFAETNVKVNVVDNGVGFSVPSNSVDFSASGHFGLISMQERAESLGGKLQIHSSPGKGTSLTVSIPIAATAPERSKSPGQRGP